MSKELGELIAAEALTWVGTPFEHQGRLKRSGVDCIGVVGMSGKNCGCKVDDRTNYAALPDGFTLEAELDRQMLVVPKEEMRAGDVPMFRIPKRPRHVAVYVGGGRMVHASYDVGKVILSTYDGYWPRQLVKVYRFKEAA